MSHLIDNLYTNNNMINNNFYILEAHWFTKEVFFKKNFIMYEPKILLE